MTRSAACDASTTGRSEAEVIRAALEAEVRAAGPGPQAVGAPAGDLPVPGRLVGIGVGPGDPDLVTVRAVVALRRADRVVAPAVAVDAVGRAETIVRQAVPGVRVERIPFAMAPGRAERDRSVEAAKSGIYGDYALRNTPDNYKRKYFGAADGGKLKIGFQPCDDSDAATGLWSKRICEANANCHSAIRPGFRPKSGGYPVRQMTQRGPENSLFRRLPAEGRLGSGR